MVRRIYVEKKRAYAAAANELLEDLKGYLKLEGLTGVRILIRYDIEDLLEIMKILCSENGCPWDKVQTHESIRMDLIEETYEACEAIDRGDSALLREELGDVLLQVVFHCQIESEKGSFGLRML